MTTAGSLGAARGAALAFVTFLLMLPETLPVPVLRGLVRDRFGVGDGLASLFMSANMVGALIAAPLAGLFVDARGGRRLLAITALAGDALLMQLLAHPHDYATFLLLRVFEGALHITALTMVTSLVADTAGERRGPALGALGAGLTLGVACGAAIGGRIGRTDPLLTLHVASAVLVVASVLALLLLPKDTPVSHRGGMRELFAMVRHRPLLRAPLVVAALERFTVGFFTTGFPLLLAGVHRADPAHIGKLLGAFLFPFAILSWPAGVLSRRWSARTMVLVGSVAYGCGVLAVPFVDVAWLWALMPWLGVCSAVMFVPSMLWLLERAGDVGRSTTIASFHAAGSLGFLLGPMCCGALVELGASFGGAPLRGFEIAFVVSGLSGLAGALLVRRTSGTRCSPDANGPGIA